MVFERYALNALSGRQLIDVAEAVGNLIQQAFAEELMDSRRRGLAHGGCACAPYH
jgi:hypothetical protein